MCERIVAPPVNLGRAPRLLPGVREGLRLAQESGIPVYVVTEGPTDTARSRLNSLDLASFTSGVLSAQKSQDLYVRLIERASPRRAVMIGDQPDRDIRLAHNAGMTTILVASRFRPEWLGANDSEAADLVAEDFFTAVHWVTETFTSVKT